MLPLFVYVLSILGGIFFNRLISASYKAKPELQFSVIDSMRLDTVNTLSASVLNYAIVFFLVELQIPSIEEDISVIAMSWCFHWSQLLFAMYQVQ